MTMEGYITLQDIIGRRITLHIAKQDPAVHDMSTDPARFRPHLISDASIVGEKKWNWRYVEMARPPRELWPLIKWAWRWWRTPQCLN